MDTRLEDVAAERIQVMADIAVEAGGKNASLEAGEDASSDTSGEDASSDTGGEDASLKIGGRGVLCVSPPTLVDELRKTYLALGCEVILERGEGSSSEQSVIRIVNTDDLPDLPDRTKRIQEMLETAKQKPGTCFIGSLALRDALELTLSQAKIQAQIHDIRDHDIGLQGRLVEFCVSFPEADHQKYDPFAGYLPDEYPAVDPTMDPFADPEATAPGATSPSSGGPDQDWLPARRPGPLKIPKISKSTWKEPNRPRRPQGSEKTAGGDGREGYSLPPVHPDTSAAGPSATSPTVTLGLVDMASVNALARSIVQDSRSDPDTHHAVDSYLFELMQLDRIYPGIQIRDGIVTNQIHQFQITNADKLLERDSGSAEEDPFADPERIL